MKTPSKPLTLAASTTALPVGGPCRDLAPEEAKEQGYWGLVYRVTISYPSGNFRDQVYVGSKSLAGNGWRTYCTSSETVQPMIERCQQLGGPVVSWEIVAYARNRKQALAIEASYINLARKEHGSRCLNKAQVDGSKIGKRPPPSNSRYSKRKPREPFGGQNVYEVG